MKVRICYTVEVTDEYRRALRAHYGAAGLATRGELRDHFREYGASMEEDLLQEYEERAAKARGEG